MEPSFVSLVERPATAMGWARFELGRETQPARHGERSRMPEEKETAKHRPAASGMDETTSPPRHLLPLSASLTIPPRPAPQPPPALHRGKGGREGRPPPRIPLPEPALELPSGVAPLRLNPIAAQTTREATGVDDSNGVSPAAARTTSCSHNTLPGTSSASATDAATGPRSSSRGGGDAAGAAPPGGDHAGDALPPLLPLRGHVRPPLCRWKVLIASLLLALRNCAFVDFRDEAAASHAHSLLNRLRFLGKVLIVERANQPKANDAVDAHVKHQDQLMPGTSQVPSIGSQNQKNPTSIAEPIAPKLGVDYPFPPHLEYSYPPPDGNILTNVVNALIAVPRFYNQVLHLMNKMNFPAPFRMALPTPPLPSQVPAPPHPPPLHQPTTTEELRPADLSSDESELESSHEDVDKRKSKRAKHESIVGPAVDKSVAHEAVGVKPAVLVSNELQVIKKKNPVLQIKIAPKLAEKEQPIPSTTDKELNSTHEQHEEKHFVTPQEIDKEKLPPEKILSLPMFKNYTPGNPASVLYIKNLAKDFTCDDSFYIFDASGSIAAVNERVVCNAAFI
ncbi:hypothetical protein U9M48_040961 [Paspalum notatum var. saurae]|uniref:Uncharacterized protein n=1 Tax=Paspalum notatum var. saurae TaxID=547442 RepID=A0AAQ3US67_PASNO